MRRTAVSEPVAIACFTPDSQPGGVVSVHPDVHFDHAAPKHASRPPAITAQVVPSAPPGTRSSAPFAAATSSGPSRWLVSPCVTSRPVVEPQQATEPDASSVHCG